MRFPRSISTRLRAGLCAALLGVATAVGVIAGPAPAGASTNYSLVRNQAVSPYSAVGWQSCQHKWVTIPVRPTGLFYDWAQMFGGLDDGAWIRYDETFHGHFYWTACIERISTPTYNFQQWARLDRCDPDGTNCHSIITRNYYFDLESAGHYDWGSQIWVAPPVG